MWHSSEKDTHHVRGKKRRLSTWQDQSILRTTMGEHDVHGRIKADLSREMEGLEGQAIFEDVEDFFLLNEIHPLRER